jgi:hypothetical protein
LEAGGKPNAGLKGKRSNKMLLSLPTKESKSTMPIPNPKLAPGERLYHWQIVAVDGRRVTARCHCHQIRIVAIEDLLSGARSSCGCSPPLRGHGQYTAQQHRRRSRELFDWRPERGR